MGMPTGRDPSASSALLKSLGVAGLMCKAILGGWERMRDEKLDEMKLDVQELIQQYCEVRERWMSEDLESWLACNKAYDTVPDVMVEMVSRGAEVFIITTKQKRFAQALLEDFGVELPEEKLFALEDGPKTQVLKSLLARPEYKNKSFHFVEDKLGTLRKVAQDPDLKAVKLHLASWGYCTQKDIDVVQAGLVEGVSLLSQQSLEARLAAKQCWEDHGKLLALQARWRRFQTTKQEVQQRRRRRQLRGIWTAAAWMAYQMSRLQRERRLRGRQRLLGTFWCLARARQLLSALRRRVLQRRSRRLWAALRTATALLCVQQRAHRRLLRQKLQRAKGAMRAAGWLMLSLRRIRSAHRASFKRHFKAKLRALARVLMLLALVKRARKQKRLRGLRGCWRASAVALRSCHRARRRTKAAVEIQRHARTFLERETLTKVAKLRGQRHAARCFRGVAERYQARVEMMRLRALAAVSFFKIFLPIISARGVLMQLRRERNARMIQTVTRGLLCRRKFKELLTRRQANASRELKAYLEAARCRLKFAEFRRCEGFHRAGALLSETKSLNGLLGFSSRYTQLRSKTPQTPSRRADPLRSVSSNKIKVEPPEPVVAAEVTRSFELLRAAAGHMSPRKSEPANPEKPPTRIVVAHNGGNITGTSFKTKSASNMSASSRRSKPRSEASCPSELLETPRSEGCSVSRASPAASSRSRTSPSRERLALEKSAAEASALYTSGALTGLRSPHRRSVSPPKEFVIDVVDPRVAMFSHRSMSPVKNRRRSLPRQAGDASRQEGQPETAVAAQTLVSPAAPALAALPETLTASQPEELPKLPEAELAPPELPEPPEPEDKVKLDEFEDW
ncbi:unnamed protein product [Effrenium voratum]|uniref:Uncharacterized protein n=1 Tax=Effrenium voratum TaxID=2562239 RepID=A0AA36I811_9DINO|nr:unnamed protein product [Effrenium voratum]